MELNIKQTEHKYQIANHIVFWLVSFLISATLYCFASGSVSYQQAVIVTLAFLPVHLIYFYITAYWLIPRYFVTRKLIKFSLLLTLHALFMCLLYRASEIFLIEPNIAGYLSNKLTTDSTAYLNSTLSGKFTDSSLLVDAFRQTNTIIWLALSIRYIKMYNEHKQYSLQTELKFLKAQLHPHFLFNTLNNLYSLTLKNSAQASNVVLGLAEIMRYMLYECNTENIKLTRDLEILKNYVDLEKIRYGNRLHSNFQVNGNMQNLYIAPLLLLPLVENAFKYGTAETINDPWIDIEISIIGNQLRFKVSNSKPANKDEQTEFHFEKIGFANVRKRLNLIYKDNYQFKTYQHQESFVALIEIRMNNNCTQQKDNQVHKIIQPLKPKSKNPHLKPHL